jgi:hypothetical protein
MEGLLISWWQGGSLARAFEWIDPGDCARVAVRMQPTALRAAADP